MATRAPSIHNTQPWRFVLAADVLELWADRRRQLEIADLDGRALLVSCGGALHLVCLGFAAQGWRTMTERLPDPAEPDLLARVRFVGRRTANLRVQEMAAAAARRHTERRPFGPGPVSPELLSSLCATVHDPGVYVHSVRRPDERLDLAVAVSWADGCRRGTRHSRPSWPAGSGRTPGSPTTASRAPRARMCRRPAAAHRGSGPRLRGRRSSMQELAGDVDEQPVYLVVFSRDDNPTARLRSGEAYARLSVKAQQLGLASSAITQALDIPGVRGRLKVLMSWPDHPQMILRVGWPPGGDEAPPTARRPIAAVLSVIRPMSPC